MPLPPCMSRARRAISSALPQLLRFISEIAGGAALPASISRPSRSAPARPSAIPAELGRPHGAPDDAVARIVEAAERARQPLGIGQQIFLRHLDTRQRHLARERGAQAELAFDRGGGEALGATLHDEAAD